MATTSLYGVRDVMKELRELDKDVFFEAVREIKKAAAPMARGIESGIPTAPPISGMARGRVAWRKTKVAVVYGGRKKRGAEEWPLLKLALKDGGAQQFDMAGKLGSSPFSQALSGRYGGPSRAMWRNHDKLLRETQEAVKDAIERASKKVNKTLSERPAGA